MGVGVALTVPFFAPPNIFDEESPVPVRLLVTFAPRLLRFTVAPFPPIDVLRPLLLTLTRMPGAILKLFRIRKAMTQLPEKAKCHHKADFVFREAVRPSSVDVKPVAHRVAGEVALCHSLSNSTRAEADHGLV
jgi:hypothetical protein